VVVGGVVRVKGVVKVGEAVNHYWPKIAINP